MSERPAAGLRYSDAGVDRDAANRAKQGIGALVARTLTENVLSRPGGFGGLFRVPAGYRSPVLVASADGVGTKLKVAMLANRHDTVGIDLVNHCINDILVEGAKPLFFLDYIGMGRLAEHVVEDLVAGMASACEESGCALIGGETAELPDFYAPGEYDLAGFIVGVVEEEERPGVHRVDAGDTLIGIAAEGFHTNGYSLLRRVVFERMQLAVDDPWPGGQGAVADVLLRPHPSYAPAVHPLLAEGRIHALAHITGGGIPENLDRILPPELSAYVDRSSWTVPQEFSVIMQHGNVDRDEMDRTFNMGVGMVLVVAPQAAEGVIGRLAQTGRPAWRMGEVRAGAGTVVMEDG
jgi:phosphoribosylformylglycinamidine cyclo-ligase